MEGAEQPGARGPHGWAGTEPGHRGHTQKTGPSEEGWLVPGY